MEDWLQDFNLSEVSQFIEYLDKTSKQCFLDERCNIRDVVGFPGISRRVKKNCKELHAQTALSTH